MAMTNKDKVDEIVDLIDSFMEKDGGHLNIKLDQNQNSIAEEITIEKVPECKSGACVSPTLFEGLDVDSKEEK